MKIKCFFITTMLLCLSWGAKAQFWSDKKNNNLTIKGLNYLYDHQFVKAEVTLRSVKMAYSNHPLSHLIDAVIIQNKYLPLERHPTELKSYMNHLQLCVDGAKKLYEEPQYRKEATFYLLASYGFMALTYNYQKEYLSAVNVGQKAYHYFKEGIKYKNESLEFMFGSGLYNFYREQYPVSHPVVKPMMIFFDKGDRVLGLKELESAAYHSVFSRVEAANYLTVIHIKYTSNFVKAKKFAQLLYQKYPNNPLFIIRYIETLLLNREFGEAKTLIQFLPNDPVSNFSKYVFMGYLEEYYTKKFDLAFGYYSSALKLKADERYTKEYLAMAYLGIGNEYKRKNQIGSAKQYYKLAQKEAENAWIKKAARL